MPRGDKDKYTDKQKRKAEHIEESYEDRGLSKKRPKPVPGPPSTNSPEVATGRVARGATRLPARRRQPALTQLNARPSHARVIRAVRVFLWKPRASKA